MRLHQLTVTAFGPFAGTVRVDFDALSAAGLFLLSGATGAGKTTVLDAVCFGLYGDVPGDRATAKRLRSDHAEPSVRPQVVLEATLAGRRFRITRSPAWVRPKRRGTGTTTEPASVAVSERIGADWTPLTTRLDEAGQLVSGLLGMNMSQFVQVALLPQGRFQTFLRARSEDRQRLLQQLFRTGRFAQVEQWLKEHRSHLRRRTAAAHQPIAEAVHRISEATGEVTPDWDLDDLALPVLEGEVDAWVAELLDRTRTDRDACTDLVRAAATAEASVRTELEAARARAERLERLSAARAEHAALQAAAEEHEVAVAALGAARRAAPVLPLDRLLRDAGRRAEEAVATAAALAGDRSADELRAELTRRLDERARAQALRPAVARLTEVEADRERLTAEQEQSSAELAVVESRRARAPERIAGLRSAAAEAVGARAGLEAAALRLDDAVARHEARLASEEVEVQLADARIRLQEARVETLARREHWLQVREARLEGMAAEIAGALAVGACCPVCGSAEHPSKAVAAPDAPDGEAERRALREVDDAKATEHLRDLEVRDLTTRLAALRTSAGGDDAAALERAEQEARDRYEELRALADGEERAAGLLTEAETALAEDEELAVRLGRRVAETARDLRALGEEAARLAVELGEVLGDPPVTDLDQLLADHDRAVAALQEALDAVAERSAAEQALAEAREVLRARVREAGFESTEEARSAALADADLRVLEDQVAQHRQRLAAVREVLDADAGADDDPAPDLEALVCRHAEALDRLGVVRSAVEGAARRHERVRDLAANLGTAVLAWRPLHDRLEVATRLCGLVEGRSADNRWQMRLSAYVLAYRLSQVVAAANVRLARMSDRRYSLEHTARRGAGETRGGLSLAVRDDWSGESRDPATLSGGETFVVSLALALGLADVIAQEAGGADLDTLFVDEGFGSLDADTLDDVMDTLDSLRDGGRVVGVVSHVAEMRDRIPTQLVVRKDPRGSTVSVRGA